MQKNNLKYYLFFILLCEAVGIASAWITKDSMSLYSMGIVQPPLSPPAIVFPIVWTILYALMGIGAARVYLADMANAPRNLLFFFLQLIVNFFWSIIFFNLQAFGFAVIWTVLLLILILAMILSFSRVDRLAAALQLPYLLWVSFATYLTIGVWLLNR